MACSHSLSNLFRFASVLTLSSVAVSAGACGSGVEADQVATTGEGEIVADPDTLHRLQVDHECTGCNFTGWNPTEEEEPYEGKYRGINVQGSNFTNVVLSGMDFGPREEGCPPVLIYSRFTRAILVGANLTDAILRSADLTKTDLIGAILTKTDLIGAYMNRATLTDASLTGAYMSGAYMNRATLTDASLTGAYMSGAHLNDANLTRAILTKTDLIGANLTGANLTGANLTEADLIGANLTNADLSGANLTRADLLGADLREANLSGTTLRGARYNNQYGTVFGSPISPTKWPDGFNPEGAPPV